LIALLPALVYAGNVVVLRVAAGTAHGLGIVDFVQRRVIYAKCTLNPAGQTLISFIPVMLLPLS